MLNVVVFWGLPEDVVVLVSRLDHVLSAYPNETHHAAPKRGKLVVLALTNPVQYLILSFDIRLVKIATYFKPLIVTSTSCRGAFCNPPIVFALRRIFLLLRLYLFTDRSRLLLLCFFPAFSVLGDWGGGGGVFLLVTVFR